MSSVLSPTSTSSTSCLCKEAGTLMCTGYLGVDLVSDLAYILNVQVSFLVCRLHNPLQLNSRIY